MLRARFLVIWLVTHSTVSLAAGLGPWTLGPPTNNGAAHDGVAGVPGFLYTITNGGTVEVAPIHSDGSLSPWSFTSTPDAARAFGIMVASSSHVYVAGGWTSGCCRTPDNSQVEVATISPDGSLSAWTFTASMTIPRANHAGAVGAGRLYMLANYGGSASVESAAIQADGSLSPWRTETSMLRARERPAAAVVGNHLYVIGGLPFTTSVERAPIGSDGVLGAWEYVSSTQRARYELGASAIGSSLFAIGGYNNTDGSFASVEIADESGGALGPWSFTSSMTRPRDNSDAAAVGNTVYVVGPGSDTSTERSMEFASLPGGCTAPTSTTLAGDADGDGVPDAQEACACLGTASGVPVTALGCSLDQACPCAAPIGRSHWMNHGEYVRCVKGAAREVEGRGVLPVKQGRRIVRTAARSACGL